MKWSLTIRRSNYIFFGSEYPPCITTFPEDDNLAFISEFSHQAFYLVAIQERNLADFGVESPGSLLAARCFRILITVSLLLPNRCAGFVLRFY